MGRLRTKDHDLEPGWRRRNGRLYYQPTTEGGRAKRRFAVPDGPMVYFIRAKAGAVKIGFTSSREALENRMSTLRSASPTHLSLLGVVPGTRVDEAKAHAALRLFRRSGEWFGPHRAVTEYIRHTLKLGRVADHPVDGFQSCGKQHEERTTDQALANS